MFVDDISHFLDYTHIISTITIDWWSWPHSCCFNNGLVLEIAQQKGHTHPQNNNNFGGLNGPRQTTPAVHVIHDANASVSNVDFVGKDLDLEERHRDTQLAMTLVICEGCQRTYV